MNAGAHPWPGDLVIAVIAFAFELTKGLSFSLSTA